MLKKRDVEQPLIYAVDDEFLSWFWQKRVAKYFAENSLQSIASRRSPLVLPLVSSSLCL